MVIGGFLKESPTNQALKIDIRNNKVSHMSSMNKKRYSHACSKVVLDGLQVILVAGKVHFVFILNVNNKFIFCSRWI